MFIFVGNFVFINYLTLNKHDIYTVSTNYLHTLTECVKLYLYWDSKFYDHFLVIHIIPGFVFMWFFPHTNTYVTYLSPVSLFCKILIGVEVRHKRTRKLIWLFLSFTVTISYHTFLTISNTPLVLEGFRFQLSINSNCLHPLFPFTSVKQEVRKYRNRVQVT